MESGILIGTYPKELLDEFPIIKDEFHLISQKEEKILLQENDSIIENPDILCKFREVILLEGVIPNLLMKTLELQNISLKCMPKFRRITLGGGGSIYSDNHPIDTKRSREILHSLKNGNSLALAPDQLLAFLTTIRAERELNEVSAYAEIQIIDPKGKRKPGEKLSPNTNYVLRVWLRRLNNINDPRQLETPIEKSAITNKKIDVVLYTPDNVDVDAFRKKMIVSSLEALDQKRLPGDFVDYNIKTPNTQTHKSRSKRDYLTFSIDLYHRHLMIGWLKFHLPFLPE